MLLLQELVHHVRRGFRVFGREVVSCQLLVCAALCFVLCSLCFVFKHQVPSTTDDEQLTTPKKRREITQLKPCRCLTRVAAILLFGFTILYGALAMAQEAPTPPATADAGQNNGKGAAQTANKKSQPLTPEQKLKFGLTQAFWTPSAYLSPAVNAFFIEHSEVKRPDK